MSVDRITILSPDRRYRYTLWREWGIGTLPLLNHQESADSYCNFICLNPSTADETKDDPTIRRCVGFAKQWGYGAFVMTNLFAWRETSPKLMKKTAFPIGDDNDMWLLRIASGASKIITAWGKDGEYLNRGAIVRAMLKQNGLHPCHLGVCQNGEPKHPLYLSKNLSPITI